MFALARAAGAADLLPPPPALEPPPPAADGIQRLVPARRRRHRHQRDHAEPRGFARSAAPSATLRRRGDQHFYNPTISSSGIFDFGFGYQFNNWFRADVTGEYRGGASFQTLEVLNDPTIIAANTQRQQYADFYRANLSSW